MSSAVALDDLLLALKSVTENDILQRNAKIHIYHLNINISKTFLRNIIQIEPLSGIYCYKDKLHLHVA